MKKILVVLLVICLFVTILASCTGTKGTDGETVNQNGNNDEESNEGSKSNGGDSSSTDKDISNKEEDSVMSFLIKNEEQWYSNHFNNEKEWFYDNQDLSDSEILTRYSKFVNYFNVDDIKSIGLALQMAEFYLPYTEGVEYRDRIFAEFKNHYDRVYGVFKEIVIDNHYNKTISIPNYSIDGKYTSTMKFKIDIETLKEINELFNQYGLDFDIAQTSPQIKIKFDYLLESFSNYISSDLKEFLDLEKWEEKHSNILEYGKIQMSWEFIRTTLASWEEFVTKYPNNVYVEKAKEYLNKYIDLYFTVDNKTYYNSKKYSGGYIIDDLKESYERFIVENKNSQYHEIVLDYISLLKENSYMGTGEVSSFITSKGFGFSLDTNNRRVIESYESELSELQSFKNSKNYVQLKKVYDSALVVHEVYTVKDVKGFVEAIGPNRIIHLEPGTYYLDEVEVNNDYLETGQGDFKIKNVKNLKIEGLGKNPVNILTRFRMPVITLEKVEGVELKNLRIGHTNGNIKGGIVNIYKSDEVAINESILFGEGLQGIYAYYTDELTFVNSMIIDCIHNAVSIYNCSDTTFKNGMFSRNGYDNTISIFGSYNTTFEFFNISNNTNNNNPIIDIENSKDLLIKDSVIENNEASKISSDDKVTVLENVIIRNNTFDNLNN